MSGSGALPPLADQPIVSADGRPTYQMVQWMQQLAAYLGIGGSTTTSGGAGSGATLPDQISSLTTLVEQALLLASAGDAVLPAEIQTLENAVARLQIGLDAGPGHRQELPALIYVTPDTMHPPPAFVPPTDGILHLLNGGRVLDGWGAPNGTVYGDVGDEYLQLDGTSTGGALWIKNAGTNSDTGWAQPGGVQQIIVIGSAFLNAGTITNTGTISSPTLAATGLLGGTLGAQATNVAVGQGLTFTASGTAAPVLALETSQAIRTVPFPMIGTLQSGQEMNITFTQAGTLLANGGTPQAFIGTNPTATQHLTLNTIHSGTVIAQGTVTISTAGSTTFPSFAAVPIAAGDTGQLLNQATADATFGNACLSFQLQVT